VIKNHDSMFFAPLIAREKQALKEDAIADWLFEYRKEFVTLTVRNGTMKCIQCERSVGEEYPGLRSNLIYEDDGEFTCDTCFDTVYEDKAKIALGYQED